MLDQLSIESERLIAEGGMASVYLAVQESLDRRVALKVLEKFDTAEHAQRFRHEGRVIASLNHHNIITIYDIGRASVDGAEQDFILMEYFDGRPLDKIIPAGGLPAAPLVSHNSQQ